MNLSLTTSIKVFHPPAALSQLSRQVPIKVNFGDLYSQDHPRISRLPAMPFVGIKSNLVITKTGQRLQWALKRNNAYLYILGPDWRDRLGDNQPVDLTEPPLSEEEKIRTAMLSSLLADFADPAPEKITAAAGKIKTFLKENTLYYMDGNFGPVLEFIHTNPYMAEILIRLNDDNLNESLLPTRKTSDDLIDMLINLLDDEDPNVSGDALAVLVRLSELDDARGSQCAHELATYMDTFGDSIKGGDLPIDYNLISLAKHYPKAMLELLRKIGAKITQSEQFPELAILTDGKFSPRVYSVLTSEKGVEFDSLTLLEKLMEDRVYQPDPGLFRLAHTNRDAKRILGSI